MHRSLWLAIVAALVAVSAVAAERPRLAVLTDIGGDPDDQQSLIRLMVYSNEFEIEALIASASGTRGELKETVTRPDQIRQVIQAFGQVRPNLLRHAPSWPSEELLLGCVKSGNPHRERTYIGEGHDTEGSRFLIERIDAGTRERPLNISIWGGQTDFAQALWHVKHERSDEKYREFVSKFRVFDINDQDGIADWMRSEFPGMHYILASAPRGRDKREGTYRGMYLTGDESLTSREWIERHVLSTGPLGALYPLKTWTAPNSNSCLKEGDTPSWFFFLPLGGNDPADPSKPGWGGQYERQPDGWYRDFPVREGFDPRHSVSRWRGDFQRDFARRMSWCLAESSPTRQTRVSIDGNTWRMNGEATYPRSRAQGLLMNVRMVNAVFDDPNRKDFDADANTDEFIDKIPEYVSHGVRAFTICLQGGRPYYEGPANSAFRPDGSLRDDYLRRTRRVIETCDRHGAVVILGCYYQMQDQVLADEQAVRAGVVNVASWVQREGFTNVVLEVANEFGHGGFDHALLKSPQGQAELIRLARRTAPGLLVSTSGLGNARLPDEVAQAADFLLIHFNSTKLEDVPARIEALKPYGKPIVCNEDEKLAAEGARAAELCVANGVSWGLMAKEVNQAWPFEFKGAADDPAVYAKLKELTTSASDKPDNSYYPPSDSAGGWRTLESPEEVRRVAGMDAGQLDKTFQFIQGTTANGGLLVVRHGWLVYERYFGLGHHEASPNLASCGKSVTSIAVGILLSERPELFPDGLDQKVFTPTYFPPEAFPLSDPRKAEIKLGQLLAFTAGIRGNNPAYVRNQRVTIDPIGPDGWPAKIDALALGKQDGKNTDGTPVSTATLWCEPGEGYSYASASIHLASIMLRHVTGRELEDYVRDHLAQPLGWGRWGYGYKYAPEVTHTPGGGGIALRPTDMLRFGYLLLHEGRWNDRQLVPAEYVRDASRASRFNPHFAYSLQFNVNTGGQIPELPRDAYWKSGSGGHVLYVVPSLDLVVWKLGGRDGQYSPRDTGLPTHPAAAREAQRREGWKESVPAETALRQTLQMVIEAIGS